MWFFASERATNLNTALEILFYDEKFLDDFLDNPVEPHELLRALPQVLAAIQQDPVKQPPKWWPERLNDYIERYMDAHPEYEDRRVDIEEAYCRHPSIAMFEIADAIEEKGA